jgi:hypothetical protein
MLAVGIVVGIFLYHIVCEIKIRQIRVAYQTWQEDEEEHERILHAGGGHN